jgi:hypothetical protein
MKYNCISTRLRRLINEKKASAQINRKNRNNSDTHTLLLYMLFLIPLVLTMVLKAEVYMNEDMCEIDTCIFKDAGVFFTCKRCRNSQWQDARNQNWRGEYHCAVCGVRMGDE